MIQGWNFNWAVKLMTVALGLAISFAPQAWAQDMAPTLDPRLSISNLQMTGDKQIVITGNVTSAHDNPCQFVYILLTLFDAEDQLIGNTYDSVQDLQPGMTWSFYCPVRNPRVIRYRIDKLYCTHQMPQFQEQIPMPGGEGGDID